MAKQNFFSLLIKLFWVLVLFFLGYFSYGVDYYLEYADIPGTDTITFYGYKDGISYAVWVNTGEIDYVTGSDGKIHSCFPLVGTGYTEKLGEIYFSYEGQKTYICDDYKLRGYFKIGAGGWGQCEDKDDYWKLYLMRTKIDNYFYHDDGSGGTGQAWLDGIGFSNWNTAKTSFDLQQAFNAIKIVSVVSYSNLVADGVSTGEILLKFLYPNPQDPSNPYVLKNFSFDKIYFSSGLSSDIKINGNNSPGFKYVGGLTTDNNGIITGEFVAYRGGKNLPYKLNFKIGNTIISITGNFINEIYPPFLLNLQISPNNSLNKKLIGYDNKASISIQNVKVSNLGFSNFSSYLNLNGYDDYFEIITGNNIKPAEEVNLKINYNPDKFYSGDSLLLNYKFSTDYYFKLNGYNYFVSDYTGITTTDSIYKDGKVNIVNLIPDSDSILADGKSIFWYKVKFLNSQNYPVNNLSFNTKVSDNRYFDLKPDVVYQTGFFVLTSDSLADSNGIYKLGIISYKPISSDLSAYLTGVFKNIVYNGYYPVVSPDKNFVLTNLSFLPVTSFSNEDKIIPVNKSTTINLNYTSNGSFVSNGSYIFTGYIFGCSSCGFKEGKILSNNNFGSKDFTIYLTGGTDPQELVYSGYLVYDLSGDYGVKKVYYPYKFSYNEFLFVGGGSLIILGNVLTNKRILQGLNYISTILNASVFKNRLRKFFFSKVIRGTRLIIIDSSIDKDLGTLTGKNYIFKCINDSIVSIGGTYYHKLDLYFINCQVNINYNILSANKSKLKIVSLSTKPKNIDYTSEDGRVLPGNIYIGPNVNTIQADLITDGSIFTYADSNFSLDKNLIFLSDRGINDNLKYQLFINGKIFAKNTIGGGLQNTNSRYLLPGGKYVESNWYGFGGITASVIAQAYDMKFWRNSFLKDNGTYSTGNLSSIIYNKYHCTGNKNLDKSPLCYTTIIIFDSSY